MEAPFNTPKNPQASNREDAPVPCKSFASVILDAPPSCIEFSRKVSQIFVVGTYSLIEAEDASAPQSRNGSLVLMRWDESGITTLQTVATCSAVLDLHIAPYMPGMLAVATSIGVVEMYHLRVHIDPGLEMVQTVRVAEPTVLVLSLAWMPSTEAMTTLAVSLSDGTVALVDWRRPTLIKRFEAHSLEAWTVAWSPDSPFPQAKHTYFLYSGGDDSGVRTFSARDWGDHGAANDDLNGAPVSSISNPGFDTRIHGAGVTAILPFFAGRKKQFQKVLLTGSYDEHVRVLVESPNGRWKSVTEKRLGGGVWRLKVISSPDEVAEVNRSPDGLASSSEINWVYHILASCMHAGARILQVRRLDSSGNWSIKVLAKFEEHESINYGGDATLVRESSGIGIQKLVVASTSFYDRKLCLWNFSVPDNADTMFEIGRL